MLGNRRTQFEIPCAAEYVRQSGIDQWRNRARTTQEPLEFFCIQVHALATMSARLRLAVHPSTS